jgi:integrase/recombinase XerD
VSPIHQAVQDYITIRRALGFKLVRQAALLVQFADYAEARAATRVTIDLALDWATRPSRGSLTWWHQRLSVVRGLATYLQTLDPATEVPPADLLPTRVHRATPYLYSADEITAILAAATTLRFPIRVATYQTLIGLLATTGMRQGEAIRLDRDDVDLSHGSVRIVDSKFGKSRELPLHSTTSGALCVYDRRRDQLHPKPATPSFFISVAGTRLLSSCVDRTFQQLVSRAGLRPRSASCRPRLHDLRHSFAVNTLLAWYRDGLDVQARLPLLSTYLGHRNPAATYWYLSASPELLALAGARLERSWQEPS